MNDIEDKTGLLNACSSFTLGFVSEQERSRHWEIVEGKIANLGEGNVRKVISRHFKTFAPA